MTTIPLVTQPLDDLNVNENAGNTTINLFEHFDDPFTTGKVALFELEKDSLGGGVTNVLLFDQEGAGAPATVANFSNYVEDDDYANSIIHRSRPNFVVQGGGFTVSDDLSIGVVPADEPVVNEFSEDRSNTRGTIAMAKLNNDPDSATNQWFFNLGDNSGNLDNQNGGFTVFGEVLSESDLAPVDAIANLTVINATGANPAFTDLPIIVENAQSIDSGDDLVRYDSISISEQPELEFEVTENSNPDLVDLSIEGGELSIDYASDLSGTAEITIQATDLLGDSVEETFAIAVEEDVEPNTDTDNEMSDGDTDTDTELEISNEDGIVYSLFNEDTEGYLYTSSEAERDAVLENLPNYTLDESFSYRSVDLDSITGSAVAEPVYRFFNEDSGTHFYTISEVEKESVEANLSNFDLETESSAFFAYAESQPDTIPIYRLYNTNTGAHFYTSSEEERGTLEDTADVISEGIAYYVPPVEV